MAALLAMLLTLPSLWVGFAQDDYIFLTIFRGAPDMPVLEQSIWDTYTFSEGDPGRNRERMERGILPWWAVPEWKVDMWRPLPSLSHWLDFQLFGENPLPMHAHSIFLYGTVCLVVGFFFRSLLGPAAVLAALVFAVDSGHGVAVGWLANRHALYVALFGTLALYFHHRWRQQSRAHSPWRAWLRYGLAALISLAIALFCGEGSVGLGGFFFAYAVFLDPVASGAATSGSPLFSRLARSIATLLPYLGAVVAWRLLYNLLGHGTHGSWLYTDPLKEPAAFIQNFPVYFPLNLFGVLGTPDSTLWLAVPGGFQLPVLLGVVGFLAFMAWGFSGVLRERAEARFLALGTLLALVPPCSTLPADRNLVLASVGAAGLIGLTLHWYHHLPAPPRRTRALQLFAATCFVIHLVVAPVLLPGASQAIAWMDRGFKHANDSAVPPALDGRARYVALNTPVDLLGASLPIFRAAAGQPQPERWWWLCAGSKPVEVRRTGDRQLVLEPRGGFLQQPLAQTFRWPGGYPMAAGDEVPLDGMTARVLAISDGGRPLAVQFTFDEPLDSPIYRWITWSEGEYVPVTLPETGHTMEVPGLDFGVIWSRLVRLYLPENSTSGELDTRRLDGATEAENVPRL